MIHEIMEFCIKERVKEKKKKSFAHGHRHHRDDDVLLQYVKK